MILYSLLNSFFYVIIYKYLKNFNDMANNKLAIIGGSGLYDVKEFKDKKLIKIVLHGGTHQMRF